jgi:hypothetical protein
MASRIFTWPNLFISIPFFIPFHFPFHIFEYALLRFFKDTLRYAYVMSIVTGVNVYTQYLDSSKYTFVVQFFHCVFGEIIIVKTN